MAQKANSERELWAAREALLSEETLAAMRQGLTRFLRRRPTDVEVADIVRGYLDQKQRFLALEQSLTDAELDAAFGKELCVLLGGEAYD